MNQNAYETSGVIVPAYPKLDLYSSHVSTMFISVGAAPITNAVTGLIEALESAAYATASPPTNPPQLRCVKWDKRLNSEKNDLLLKDISFYACDSLVSGGSGADADNITAIENSLANPRGAWSSSRFAYGILPTFFPNLFRPVVLLNGQTALLNEVDTLPGQSNPIADRSVGVALPYNISLNTIIKGPIRRLEVYGMVGQYLNDSISADKWQMYPLVCEITFGFRDATLPPVKEQKISIPIQTSVISNPQQPVVQTLPKATSITNNTQSGSQLTKTNSIIK